MAFGNGPQDYANTALVGWGSLEKSSKSAGATAEKNPFSLLCPKCGQSSVEETDASTVDLTAQKLKCGHCGWETKPEIL